MTLKSKIKKTATAASGLAAVAFVPQHCDAEIVTVGGDGGTGSVVLSTSSSTDLGGVLGESLQLLSSGFYGRVSFTGAGRLGAFAARSALSTTGASPAGNKDWVFNLFGSANGGAQFGSDDNWLTGFFSVNGVNGGDDVFGWLQVGLDSTPGSQNPEILSFTYDNMATDTTAFAKPIGGFSVGSTAVPEPSSLAGLALLACGAAGVRRRRLAA